MLSDTAPSLVPYYGKTWVAFLDICGFKQKIKDSDLAEAVLEKFFNTVYSVTEFNFYKGMPPVCSIIVSDCAVIFVDNQNGVNTNESIAERKISELGVILSAVRRINKILIENSEMPAGQIMTTCAISHGEFTYNKLKQGRYTDKTFFYGPTYVQAYLGNEELSKTPGYCRILDRDLMIPQRLAEQDPYKLLYKNGDYYNYYWMLDDLTALDAFNNKYSDLAQDVYRQMAQLVRDAKRICH